MDDSVGLYGRQQFQNSRAIANIHLMVLKRTERGLQPPLIPPRIAGFAEKHGPLVIVNAVDSPSAGVEKGAYFGTDQSRGTGNKEGFHRINLDGGESGVRRDHVHDGRPRSIMQVMPDNTAPPFQRDINAAEGRTALVARGFREDN
jgi:hypothetical protein